jgi:hypothetical protein
MHKAEKCSVSDTAEFLEALRNFDGFKKLPGLGAF